jgi:hypothetical protein
MKALAALGVALLACWFTQYRTALNGMVRDIVYFSR